MADALVYVSRIVRLPLLDADGDAIGRVTDVVLGPAVRDESPRVLGIVVGVQRRRIFVSVGRIGHIGVDGVRLQSGTIDLRPFQLRSSELLAGDLLDRRVAGEVVDDLGLRPDPRQARTWEVASVALGTPGVLGRRRASRLVDWHDVRDLFDAGAMAGEVAVMREMHPSDVARAIRRLSLDKRRQLAEIMEDDRLADLLEELPEAEQLRIIEGLDLERAAHVIEEMAPDDAADLLGEMAGEERSRLLAAMDPDEADPVRRLLVYDHHTAGGLMTPEPVIAHPLATVAHALARLREPELPAAIAAQVFVTERPTQPPTGLYLGAVGFQRLLREAPGNQVGRCLDEHPDPIGPDLAEVAVAERLAAYNLLAVPVCDAAGRLLGAVTVDDVLDRTLPAGWRQG